MPADTDSSSVSLGLSDMIASITSCLFVLNCRSAVSLSPSYVLISLAISEWKFLLSTLKFMIGFSNVSGFLWSCHAPISFSRNEMKSGVMMTSVICTWLLVVGCWCPELATVFPVIVKPANGFDICTFWLPDNNANVENVRLRRTMIVISSVIAIFLGRFAFFIRASA